MILKRVIDNIGKNYKIGLVYYNYLIVDRIIEFIKKYKLKIYQNQ